MNVAITGASGMIGKRLRQRLAETGHTALPIPRAAGDSALAEILASADAVVHLAGEPVAQRWTEAAKKRIHDSRVEGTRRLVNALSAAIPASACAGVRLRRRVLWLARRRDPHRDLLPRHGLSGARGGGLGGSRATWRSRWASAWFSLRFGMVLGHGGALAKLLPLFRLGVGGRLGSGRQWMAWIHMEDAVNLILFALNFAAIQGAVNATAPHPVTNCEFTRRLAATLHRPAIFPVPAFALKLALGEMSEMVLASQRVLPTVAKSAGFRFQYPELQRRAGKSPAAPGT